MTIEEFIEARLAEDERIAHRATRLIPDERADWLDATEAVHAGYDELVHAAPAHIDGYVTEHIARHDPARVLRQCTALRAVVVSTRDRIAQGWGHHDIDHLVEADLAPIAAIWDRHPDYQQQWAADAPEQQ